MDITYVHGSIKKHLANNPRGVIRSVPEAWRMVVTRENQHSLTGLSRELFYKMGMKAGLTLDETKSYCLEGFIIAACRFDESRGFKLVTYARRWAMARIQRAIRKDLRPERMQPVSMDEPQRNGMSLLGNVADTNPNPEERLMAEEVRQYRDSLIKERILSRLRPNEQLAVRLRFGLGADEDSGLTLGEIGKQLGVTRERARQILESANKKLGRSLAKDREEIY